MLFRSWESEKQGRPVRKAIKSVLTIKGFQEDTDSDDKIRLSLFMPEQSKKENPLLARGLAFCSAKLGGFDMLLQHERIWITGAQGQVGSAFARMLDTTELDVLLTDIDEVDITDMDAVRNYAEMYRPDCVINCAGICGPAFCEENSDLAYKVNAVGARNLSVAARSVHAELVQISTDDIFDGRASEPYNEFSTPMPVTVYGKSKLAGEEFVKTIVPKFLIIRSSWVYGDGENFVTQLLRRAETESCIRVPGDQLDRKSVV